MQNKTKQNKTCVCMCEPTYSAPRERSLEEEALRAWVCQCAISSRGDVMPSKLPREEPLPAPVQRGEGAVWGQNRVGPRKKKEKIPPPPPSPTPLPHPTAPIPRTGARKHSGRRLRDLGMDQVWLFNIVCGCECVPQTGRLLARSNKTNPTPAQAHENAPRRGRHSIRTVTALGAATEPHGIGAGLGCCVWV